MKTAIILGATGLTGNILLHKLLADDYYAKVIVFGRRTVGLKHPKMQEYIVDLFELEKYKEQFRGDVVFCCVGSTQKKTPKKKIYQKVDFGIPVTAAKLCRQNGIRFFEVISALGANANSRFFYNRIKGEMELEVMAQNIQDTYVFRPSLIGGEREEKRPFEFFWKQVMKTTDFLMFGPLKKFKPIHPETIATAMIFVAKNRYRKLLIKSEEIEEIAANA
ncbi:MAG TPA: NAD(P)H-binding protein [Flavobacteriaceae bacterium]|nr:NAD(P)H-binding protein [Flavobacteriaceae bacterium]